LVDNLLPIYQDSIVVPSSRVKQCKRIAGTAGCIIYRNSVTGDWLVGQVVGSSWVFAPWKGGGGRGVAKCWSVVILRQPLGHGDKRKTGRRKDTAAFVLSTSTFTGDQRILWGMWFTRNLHTSVST
jgi:hypothetical protein